MAWLEQKVRRYEHMRWAQEPNRRTLPFAWGLEHIGGDAKEPDPRGFLEGFVEHTLEHSDEWYAVTPAEDYLLADDVLTFTSALENTGNAPVSIQLDGLALQLELVRLELGELQHVLYEVLQADRVSLDDVEEARGGDAVRKCAVAQGLRRRTHRGDRRPQLV